MILTWTLAGCLGAIAATASLYSASGLDPASLQFFSIWCGAPYLGYGALAFAFRRAREVAALVLVATLISGGLAVLVYADSLWPFIEARRQGVEPPLNCGGPLVELGLPMVQWGSVLVLGLIALAVRPRRKAVMKDDREFQ